jgi:hypothetical protein
MSVLKKISGLAAAAGVSIALLAATAQAAVLYDNGPANGNNDAWTINFGYVVANSFDLAGASTVTGANFTLWNFPGDVTSTVDWAIVTNPTAGSTLASGTAAAVSQSLQGTNGYGYDINLDSISLPGIALGAGTYWFELFNAVVDNDNPAFWDINGGPSQIWESAIGYNPDPNQYAIGLNNSSNSFQITGDAGNVPEPATLALFGLGLLGLGLSRRKLA